MPSSITVGMIDKRNEKAGDGGGGSAFNNPAYTGPGAINGYSRDRIEITHIPERNVVREEATNLKKGARQAWREKVALFVIMMFFCAAFIGISGVIPMFLCRDTTQSS